MRNQGLFHSTMARFFGAFLFTLVAVRSIAKNLGTGDGGVGETRLETNLLVKTAATGHAGPHTGNETWGPGRPCMIT